MITLKMVVDAAWELYVEEYLSGVSLDEIARKSKWSRHAITERLKREGKYVPGRKNKPKSDVCQRGHDMAVHGLQLYTRDGRKNGRMCTECKRERQRV